MILGGIHWTMFGKNLQYQRLIGHILSNLFSNNCFVCHTILCSTYKLYFTSDSEDVNEIFRRKILHAHYLHIGKYWEDERLGKMNGIRRNEGRVGRGEREREREREREGGGGWATGKKERRKTIKRGKKDVVEMGNLIGVNIGIWFSRIDYAQKTNTMYGLITTSEYL